MMRLTAALVVSTVIMVIAGCAAPKLHLTCVDVQTSTVAESQDQHAIRHVLDLTSRLETWDKAEPIGADHLFTVHVKKLEDEKPYMEMQVYHKHTRVIMLHDPADPSDDEAIDLVTCSNLKFALSDIGEYHLKNRKSDR